jgi:hypothetical protein
MYFPMMVIRKKSIVAVGFVLLVSISALAQVQAPGELTEMRILLLNGKAHIGNGDTINKSAIAIHKGKITMVKNALLITIKENEYDTIIDISGQHVYPGFIAPNSTLGLQEIGAVRATRDQQEVGTMNPHVRSIIAFNTDSRVTATVKTNGVLLGQICPRGGRISGTSSVVHFDGWNWEDAVYKMDDAIHINWPRMYSYDWKNRSRTKSKSYDKSVQDLNAFMQVAQAYNDVKFHDDKDLRYEGMRTVFHFVLVIQIILVIGQTHKSALHKSLCQLICPHVKRISF